VNALYRRSVLIFGVVAILVGFALLIQTARHGGGTFGYVLGALFVVLGAARLWILRST
jgi:uncharacterized membrane protein HdeD (DUF308 family)